MFETNNHHTQDKLSAKPDSDACFRRYLKRLLGIAFIGCVLIVAAVIVIDPYGLYQYVDQPDFNHVKPRVDRFQAEIKIHRANTLAADAYILGNSRMENGLDPDHAGFARRGLSAYNLALSGTRTLAARHELQTLQSLGQHPKVIIMGVEFLDFLVDAKQTSPDPQKYLREHEYGRWKWRFDSAFSMTSVTDAIKTVRIQHDDNAETQAPRGLNPLLEFRKYAREEGYYAIFQQRAREYARFYQGLPHDLRLVHEDSSPDRDELRKVLALAYQDHAQIELVIYPYHAQIEEMWRAVGLWPVFEQWKRIMVAEIASFRATHQDAQIRLLDFSGYGEVQCEQIPKRGDLATKTRFYWEAGHFKTVVGERIIDTALNLPPTHSDFDLASIELKANNLDTNSERIQAERSHCLARYPELTQDVEKLIRDARVPKP